MARIFISYRRDDDPSAAGRLYDALSAKFGDDDVFMDLDTLEPGEDFWEVIKQALERADVQLAVIGRGWLTASDQSGERRLDDKEDFVRREIALALRVGVRVIPVLVNGAAMPAAKDLPSSIKRLTGRSGVQLTAANWRAGVEQLIASLDDEPSRGDAPAKAESASKPPSAPATDLFTRLQPAKAESASKPPSAPATDLFTRLQPAKAESASKPPSAPATDLFTRLQPAKAESASKPPSAPATDLFTRLQPAKAESASKPPSAPATDLFTTSVRVPPQGKRSPDELLAMAKSAVSRFQIGLSPRGVKSEPQTKALAAKLAQDEWVSALFAVEGVEPLFPTQGFLAITNRRFLYSSAAQPLAIPRPVSIESLDRSQVASVSLGQDPSHRRIIIIKRHTGTGTTAEWITIRAPGLGEETKMIKELNSYAAQSV